MDVMRKHLMLVLALAAVPTAALAEKGGPHKDFYSLIERSQTMVRDGRMQQLMDEGAANKAAFDRLKQMQDPTATGSTDRSTKPRPRR
jgi:hypothetical protein